MKLGDFIDPIVIIWKILMKIGKIWLIFILKRFPQNYTGMNSSHKNEARKLKFGLEVHLYGFWNTWNRFFQFLILSRNMAHYVQNLRHFANFVKIFDIFKKKSKIQNYALSFFRNP